MIRTLLDLSTAHLPPHLGAAAPGGGLAAVPGVIAVRTGHGWLLWVPPAGEDPAAGDRVPAEVLAVQRYARALGCAYVLLDADADRVDDLPTWDW